MMLHRTHTVSINPIILIRIILGGIILIDHQNMTMFSNGEGITLTGGSSSKSEKNGN